MNPSLNIRTLLSLLYIPVNSVLYSSFHNPNFCTMEKQNNIILAPSTSQVTELYNLWRENHSGRLTDFYKFMVNPSAARDRFISSLEMQHELTGSFIVTKIAIQ